MHGEHPSSPELQKANQEVFELLRKRKLRKAEAKIEEIARLFPHNLLAQLNLFDLRLRKKKITPSYDLHLDEFFPKASYSFTEIVAYVKILFYWKSSIAEKKEAYTLLVRLHPQEPLLPLMEKKLFKKKFFQSGWWRFRR